MKSLETPRILFLSNLATLLLLMPDSARAQSTGFTYQGRLNSGATPANGSYDLRFTIKFISAPPGSTTNTVAGPITNSAVGVINGLFTTTLDFGSGVFSGSPLWLEVAVRTNGSASAFTVLSPLQSLTSTPYSIYAAMAASAGIANTVPANAIFGLNIQDGTITAAKVGSGQVVKAVNGFTDNVTIAAGTNVTLNTNGNTLQISSTAGGGSSTNAVAKTGDTMSGSLNISTPATLGFGGATRQMISLYDNGSYHFGIGVQTSTF